MDRELHLVVRLDQSAISYGGKATTVALVNGLTSLRIRNFKSYADAELRLAPLTLLVGANASGKSNALEALQMLSWLARGRRLDEIFRAVQDSEVALRGRLKDLTRNEEKEFNLSCELGPFGSYSLAIGIEVNKNGLRIVGESLVDSDERVPLYEVKEPVSQFGGALDVAYNNFAPGGKKPIIECTDQQSVFSQLITPARFGADHRLSQVRIPSACEWIIGALERILILDPSLTRMRQSSFLEDTKLRGDGSNLSSVLFQICEVNEEKEGVLRFIRELPEQDITDLRFMDSLRGEVIVELKETFGGKPSWRDAGVLSDGTLRVLAVAAAMLSAPEGSTVVIEEVDNGVHPSRAGALLAMLNEVARKRKISVLLTSHNPALLDALPPSALPDVTFCYRDPEQGDSRLVRLQDLTNYPELIARGPLGRLVTQGIVDRMVKHPVSPKEKVAAGLKFVESLRK